MDSRNLLVVAGMAACAPPGPDDGAPPSAEAVDGWPHGSHVVPDAAWPDAAWPDAAWPDAAWPDAAWPDAASPDDNQIEVLLVHGYGRALEGEMVAGALRVDPRIGEVHQLVIEGSPAPPAPPLELLAGHDVVVFWWNDFSCLWSSARIDLGNRLADLVDAGRGLVTLGFAQGECPVLGRILTAGYAPLRPDGSGQSATGEEAALVAIRPGDPLLDGVGWIAAGARPRSALDPDAELVAAWSDGLPAIARKGRVVGLGLRLEPTDQALAGHWQAALGNAVATVAP